MSLILSQLLLPWKVVYLYLFSIISTKRLIVVMFYRNYQILTLNLIFLFKNLLLCAQFTRISKFPNISPAQVWPLRISSTLCRSIHFKCKSPPHRSADEECIQIMDRNDRFMSLLRSVFLCSENRIVPSKVIWGPASKSRLGVKLNWKILGK